MVTTSIHTAEDLWRRVRDDDRFELIEGELIEVSPGKRRHSTTQLRLGSQLLTFVETHGLGIVGTEEGFLLQRNPDTVLAPDVAFVSTARLGDAEDFWSELPPDLAVEVISPSNTRTEMDRKVRIYLESGVRLVWLVYPERREVVVHRPGQPPQVVVGEDCLDGDDVLPSISLPLTDIFGV